MDKVILATQNEGKIREMRDIFSKFGMDVISRDEMGLPKDEIEETGTTFEAINCIALLSFLLQII